MYFCKNKNTMNEIKESKTRFELWQELRKERVKDIKNINELPNIKQLLSEQDRFIEKEFSYFEDEYINSGIPYERHIGKYIKFKYFEDTLVNGLFFQQPSEWTDDFESRFYNADYSNILTNYQCKTITPRLLSCCFTYGYETEAAWKTYGNENIVRLEINKFKLLKALNCWAEENNCTIYFGYVYYTYPLRRLKDIHKGTQRENPLWFEKFELNNYLSLLLLKRQAYSNEMEERFFIIPNDSDMILPPNMKIHITLSKIVDKLILSPDFSKCKELPLKNILTRNGLLCKVTRSELNSKDKCQRIVIEKPDIDNPWKLSNLKMV